MLVSQQPNSLPASAAALFLSLMAAATLVPDHARAQYKNDAFAFEISYPLLIKPAVVDASGNLEPISRRPLRLQGVVEFSGETSFKAGADRWWLPFRINVGLYQHNRTSTQALNRLSAADSLTARYDNAARDTLGLILGVGGGIGARYFLATDRTRPYIQGNLSFTRLITFSGLRDNACNTPVVCPVSGDSKNVENFLPHPNVGGIGGQAGLELIVSRDFALNFFMRYNLWIVFGARLTHGPSFGAGVNLYH